MLLARRRRLDLLDGDLGGQELLAVQVDVAQVLAARRRRRRGLRYRISTLGWDSQYGS